MRSQIIVIGILLLSLSFIGCGDKTEFIDPPGSGNPSLEDTLTIEDCSRCMVLTEQSQPAIEIVDIDKHGTEMWSWHPSESNIKPDHVKWFSHIDDAKPIYGLKYLLITASSDGAALVRIADKKVLWYTKAGNNPHSIEVLPDGNIVVASSTDNRLVLYQTDTTEAYASEPGKVINLPFAHNIVWDKKRELLWSAGQNKLYSFEYNFNCKDPDLIPKDTLLLPGTGAHDMFPVYGKDSLWLTNTTGTYTIDLETKDIERANTDLQKNIKSVSSGPEGWPTIIQKPTTSYWADEIIDFDGNVVYSGPGWKIYKARWFLPNPFSYPENDEMKICD